VGKSQRHGCFAKHNLSKTPQRPKPGKKIVRHNASIPAAASAWINELNSGNDQHVMNPIHSSNSNDSVWGHGIRRMDCIQSSVSFNTPVGTELG
jgi:hypothetical protein